MQKLPFYSICSLHDGAAIIKTKNLNKFTQLIAGCLSLSVISRTRPHKWCCHGYKFSHGKGSEAKQVVKALSYNWMASRFLVCMILALIPLIAVAEAKINVQRHYIFNLPRQSVAESLTDLAKQTGEQFLFPYQLAESKAAKPVTGHFTLFEATQILLRDTGLTSDLVDGVLIISLMDDIGASSYQNHKGKSMNINKRKNLLATMIGLFAASGVAQQAYGQGVDSATAQSQINEVFVTADKREAKSVQDLAASISAIGGEEIDKKNLVSMDDYLRNIPGVSFQDRGAGQNSIVIRGMATGPQVDSATTATYFGETPTSGMRTPYQSSSGGSADIKLVDIERVEVLRGPQGTLYGSGSMAGTVRIIPNAPKFNQLEGSVAARYSNTAEAGGDNNAVEAVLNLPIIEDKLAVRGVVYRIDNSGFIDNVVASQPLGRTAEAVNSFGAVVEDKGGRGGDTYTGFRMAALWQITDQLDATLSYLKQDIEQDGLPEVNIEAAGDYQQQRLKIGRDQQGDEFVESDLELTNLVLNYDIGWGVINSSTSWIDNHALTGQDLNPTTGSFFGGNAYFNDNFGTTEVFVEELRLASQWEGPLQFVTGLYYEDREVEREIVWAWSGDQSIDPYPPSGLPVIRNHSVGTVKQTAAFGEVTYALSDQWETTFGARYFDYELEEIDSFLLKAEVVRENRRTLSDDKGQTYKGALSYTPNEDLLIYGQWAQGFRIGKVQPQPSTCTAVGIEVPGVDSDTSNTYELGIKSSWRDGRTTLNAAIYRTDWDDIPVLVTLSADPICNPTLNAGKAQSEGVEIELRSRLTDHLQLDISASTVDATLEETSSIGNKGDDLPGSADYNASIGIEYDFSLAGYSSFARVDYAYVGEYYNNLAGTGTPAGDFSQVHFKVGANVGQVNVDLFVNNLTNEDGFTWVESNFSLFSDSNRAYVIRPRTMGMNIRYHF